MTVKVRRGKEEMTFSGVMLTGTVNAYKQSFLGILPMRDDPEASVEVRCVYPDSPADKAGIRASDRIVKYSVGGDAMQARDRRTRQSATVVGPCLRPLR